MPEFRGSLFSQLFCDTRDSLRRYVRRFVRSGDQADEIVQEAFLRTYERARGSGSPRAFLYKVARNLATDLYRQTSRARNEPLEDGEVHAMPESGSPESVLIASERSRLLHEAVTRMSPRCRTVFVLKMFHALSYKEIADRLGITPKTVENHLSRGLREAHLYVRQRYRDVDSKHE